MRFLAVAGEGQFTHKKIAGTFEHLLFPKRETLRLFEHQQAFQNSRDFHQRPRAHAVGVLLEAVLPIWGTRAFAVGEVIENFLDVAVFDDPAQAYRFHAMEGYGHFQVAGFNVQQVILLGLGSEGTAADLFDNPYSVVRINYPIPDVEITVAVAAHTGNSPSRDFFILHDRHRLSQIPDMTIFSYQ